MDRLDIFDFHVNNVVRHEFDTLEHLLIYPDFKEEIMRLREIDEMLEKLRVDVRKKAWDERKARGMFEELWQPRGE